VSSLKLLKISELELVPEKMIKVVLPGIKLRLKYPFTSVLDTAVEDDEPEFKPNAEGEPG
jgi:hypothetical protein